MPHCFTCPSQLGKNLCPLFGRVLPWKSWYGESYPLSWYFLHHRGLLLSLPCLQKAWKVLKFQPSKYSMYGVIQSSLWVYYGIKVFVITCSSFFMICWCISLCFANSKQQSSLNLSSFTPVICDTVFRFNKTKLPSVFCPVQPLSVFTFCLHQTLFLSEISAI